MSSKIITLGPIGTFGYKAALSVNRQFEREIVFAKTLPQISKFLVEDTDLIGVLPIENSIAGIVGPAQDSLVESDLAIIGELTISVSFNLISNLPLDKIRLFYAHPQAFNQAVKFTTESMPNAEVVFSDSNVHSGELFLECKDRAAAAILPRYFSDEHPEYKDRILAKNIQDYENNTTRFFLARKKTTDWKFDFGREKTSLFVAFHDDRSSLLFELLREFHVYGVNLCRLESRPSKTAAWSYVFFIDFFNNHRVEACLQSMRDHAIDFKILGSYDRIHAKEVQSNSLAGPFSAPPQ